MERHEGLEPSFSAWKAGRLPQDGMPQTGAGRENRTPEWRDTNPLPCHLAMPANWSERPELNRDRRGHDPPHWTVVLRPRKHLSPTLRLPKHPVGQVRPRIKRGAIDNIERR